MKAKIIYRIITVAFLVFTMFACSNLSDTQNKATSANGKASVSVKLGDTARTIMPSYDNGDFTSITLNGAFDGGTTKTLKEWTSYADLCDATKGKVEDLDIGAWSFSIECKIGEKTAFTGTLTKTLAKGENTLSFTLENTNGSGAVEAAVSFECDTTAVKAVTAKLINEDGSDVTGFGEEDITLSDGKAVYKKSDVPKGTYIVMFTMYSDSEKTTVLTKASKVVNVAGGLVSKGTITVRSLNSCHAITYNLNDGEWATGVSAPMSFTEFDEVVLPTSVHIKKQSGYIFDGWYTTSTFDEGTKIKIIKAGETNDVELWANYKEGYEATADNVADIIAGLTGEGPHNVKVIGKISETKAIKTALCKNSTAKVNLDLDETTGLEKLPDGAFYNCTSLTSIIIPDSVTSIGDGAFFYCSGLTGVVIPEGVTSIGNSAFFYCSGLTSMEIPDSVTSIEIYAFAGCSGLTSVEIPDSVTSIEIYAFAGCSGLTSMVIPDSVTIIRDRAFESCSGLTSVVIGNSVTSIGECAFYECSGLTSVMIGNSVTSIGNSAFNCSGLTSVVIPDSVTSIESFAFYGCSGLTSVMIGNSVTSIGNSAFNFCSGLTSVVIGNSVTSIGECAFYECSGLTSVEIPNSVTNIGLWVFRDCTNLTSVTFKNPNGWWYADSSSATSGTSISSTDLQNTSTAATYLTSTYRDYYWKHTDHTP